jgi:hypothetical protein
MAVTSFVRVSQRIGRTCVRDAPWGAMTSRWRRWGVLLHGTVMADRPVYPLRRFLASSARWRIAVRLTSICRTWLVISSVVSMGHAGQRPGGLRLSLDQGGGHIVAVPCTPLAAVAGSCGCRGRRRCGPSTRPSPLRSPDTRCVARRNRSGPRSVRLKLRSHRN